MNLYYFMDVHTYLNARQKMDAFVNVVYVNEESHKPACGQLNYHEYELVSFTRVVIWD